MRTTIPSTQSDPDAKYTIRNIPTHYAAQKTFYNFIITTMRIRNITTLIVNNNKTALLIVPTALSDNFQKSLQTAINCTHTTISPINRKNPTHQPNPKKPTFSVVIRNVPQDITPEDITTQCSSLTIVKAWRITSRKTNRPTTLIRILTTIKDTIDDMLINGVELFGRTFEFETSHPPTPTPIQCLRCFQFGHGQAECTNKPICPKCPDSQPPNKCPAKEPSCPSCKGPHPAWSRSCPKLKEVEVTETTPVLPVKIIDQPAELTEPDDIESDPAESETPIAIIRTLIAFMTKALFDLFPLQKAKIQAILEQTSKSVFKTFAKVSHSGRNIHFTFNQ
ncbi:unnamed protein product [Tenebrio molitor]|nr:unnamed protein product [Tenebrio molitor]